MKTPYTGNISNLQVWTQVSMAGISSDPSDPHELLICGICAEPYDDDAHQAKFLACYHTFCLQCLGKLFNKNRVNPATIQCPNCRAETRLPKNGIDGLQTNFYIAGVQEISKTIHPPRITANFQGCHGHSMQPISYFCMTCRIFVCSECTTLDHTTENGHSVISISKSETNYLQELNISNKSLSQNKRNLQLVESEIALLTAAKEMALKDMETFIKLAQEKLRQRRNDLKDQILNQFKAQQKVLLDEKNQIQEAITIINKNIIKAQKITKAGGDVSKLKPICESLKEINEKTESILTQLDLGENYLAFDSNKGLNEFNACLHTLGDIYSKGFLPSRIRFQSQEVKVGQKTTLTVELYNHQGDKLPIPLEYFSVQVTDPTNTEISTELCTTAPDSTVTFIPQVSGLHQVSGSFLRQKLTSEQTHLSEQRQSSFKIGTRGNG